jgi:hypothetical protein
MIRILSAKYMSWFVVGGFLLLGRSGVHAQDLSGRWTGCWVDDGGHHGPLKATLCPCGADRYRATFTGRFFRIVPFRYTVVLAVTGRQGDKVLLAGESDLGRLFGTFTYQAEASTTDFIATYRSCRYQGQFNLKRCDHCN